MRAPYEQLMKAGEEARKLLVKKGVLSDENFIEKITKEHSNVVLPGIPSYLPRRDTLRLAQRMLYDLMRSWQFDSKKLGVKDSNLGEFIKYTIKETDRIKKKKKKKMDLVPKMFLDIEDVPVLSDIFRSVREYETTSVMTKFFIDSLAVGISIKGEATTTSEFFVWFIQWTDTMYDLWGEKTNGKKKKKSEL